MNVWRVKSFTKNFVREELLSSLLQAATGLSFA